MSSKGSEEKENCKEKKRRILFKDYVVFIRFFDVCFGVCRILQCKDWPRNQKISIKWFFLWRSWKSIKNLASFGRVCYLQIFFYADSAFLKNEEIYWNFLENLILIFPPSQNLGTFPILLRNLWTVPNYVTKLMNSPSKIFSTQPWYERLDFHRPSNDNARPLTLEFHTLNKQAFHSLVYLPIH